MASMKTISLIFLGIVFQILSAQAKPANCGCGGCGGCGYSSSPISFTPVPQPVPIKVPACKPAQQSVTIPNIILALLPPTPKAPAAKPCPTSTPPPATAPQPICIPIPQPYPVSVPDCGCSC